jgi:hypothetical protein
MTKLMHEGIHYQQFQGLCQIPLFLLCIFTLAEKENCL